MKTLYHYTSVERWKLIQVDGRIKTTESNLSQTTEHAGPDVVWLTTDADFTAGGHGLSHTADRTDKTRIRVTVELANRDVFKWREWALQRGIDREWLGVLIATAEGSAGTWRISQKPIVENRWAEVYDRVAGQVLWSRQGELTRHR